MSSLAATSTVVVLLPGPDARVLGLSVRVRNARVAARVGADVIDATRGLEPALLADCDDDTIIVAVPSLMLVEPAFFALPVSSAEQRSGVLVGRASQLIRCLFDAKAAAALPQAEPPPDSVLDTSTAAARRHAAWDILKRTAKASDGWVSRRCNRPMSRPFSFLLLNLGLSASHASIITLLVGIGAAVLASRPGYLALVMTGVLFQFASMFDGVDGEMARATLTESESGARLDAVVDQLTYVACFIGVTIGWAREGGGGQVIFWTMAIGVALVLSLMRGGRFVSRHAPNASFVFIDRAVRRAALDSGRRALRMAASGFTLLRRDVFAVIFFLVALGGRRSLIPGLVVCGIILANVTFSRYRRELAEAAIALARTPSTSPD